MNDKDEPVEEARKILTPDRTQVGFQILDLETTLPEEHMARTVWGFVEGLDLSNFYCQIRSLQGGSGRPATDPRLLFALWLYATLDGVGSARELDRRCEFHAAYRWLCGGVKVNHHTLSDFRVDAGPTLDELLERTTTALMQEGIVTLNRVTQDGTRVRANAGAASFRRGKTLKELRRIAHQQVERLRNEVDTDPAAPTKRQRAAQERAARERHERIERALAELNAMDEGKQKEPDERKQPRASTTDPEARVMKMGDGGYRPAFNIQIVGDADSQTIIGYEVTNQGTDMGLLAPNTDALVQRHGQPAAILVDGGYAKNSDIEKLERAGISVFTPVQKPKNGRDPFTPAKGDSEELKVWRRRMGTPEGQQMYRGRPPAERYNAYVKNQGLIRLLVRGVAKVKAVVGWYVLAHNFMRWQTVGIP